MIDLSAFGFILLLCGSSIAVPISSIDYGNPIYTENNSPGTRRAVDSSYPGYYYYPGRQDLAQDRQGELLDTAQRVLYTPLFRYRKKSKESKRDPTPTRKIKRIMPAYLIA